MPEGVSRIIQGRAALKSACAATNRYARSDQLVGERTPGAITLTSHCAVHQGPGHELNPSCVVLMCRLARNFDIPNFHQSTAALGIPASVVTIVGHV